MRERQRSRQAETDIEGDGDLVKERKKKRATKKIINALYVGKKALKTNSDRTVIIK